ncbi:hypothetical protein [Taibaiella chishuiensis]|uniref:Uncharacterized protein (TIGR04222 family) n=1 Tax=Taibaiella chishuiensis TaxID=1434707 RepID=A0A2P8D5K8_9BACT|nr:hypothetical protein [Taibaiella chishuiensis]PSK92513.1 uncharacterized protein (TIGR04222 family) [Taibaiella chishuiensis]
MNPMQNKHPGQTATWLYGSATLACILAPLAFIHQQYDRWNPFRLSGKHFLVFYALLLLLNHGLPYLERLFVPPAHRQILWTRVLSLLVLATGLARLIQGIYNAKPVGYLVVLLGLHLILLAISLRSRKSRS